MRGWFLQISWRFCLKLALQTCKACRLAQGILAGVTLRTLFWGLLGWAFRIRRYVCITGNTDYLLRQFGPCLVITLTSRCTLFISRTRSRFFDTRILSIRFLTGKALGSVSVVVLVILVPVVLVLLEGSSVILIELLIIIVESSAFFGAIVSLVIGPVSSRVILIVVTVFVLPVGVMFMFIVVPVTVMTVPVRIVSIALLMLAGKTSSLSKGLLSITSKLMLCSAALACLGLHQLWLRVVFFKLILGLHFFICFGLELDELLVLYAHITAGVRNKWYLRSNLLLFLVLVLVITIRKFEGWLRLNDIHRWLRFVSASNSARMNLRFWFWLPPFLRRGLVGPLIAGLG